MTNSLQFAIGLLLLLPVSWLFNGKMNATWAALPLILVLQMMFYVGLTWIWASLTVYIPDLRQSTALLLTVVMFLTPIFYPIEIVPEWAQPIMRGNPFANLVTIYRLTIMDGILPSLAQWVFLIAVAFISFMLGYFWFFRTKKGFADVL
jgi:lipopolysaccharide transport system permease protein